MYRYLPIHLVIVAFFLLLTIPANAKESLKEVVTKHANGEKKLVYSVNEKGEREGAYSAYYADGIRRGNSAKIKWIIDNWHKEISGTDH